MDDLTQKLDYRIMGDYSIAKSYKGILRIAHILELVQNEDDRYFNPTYFGIPKTLMNISGGAYESAEMGFATPIDGMNGNITRYSSANPKIETDSLRIQRVPMTDSMGNYMNWNIGVEGVTIGSDENISGNHIDLESFQQTDYIKKYGNGDGIIWQQKYFPVLEAGHIVIGLENKEFQNNKTKINEKSCLIVENFTKNGQVIVENAYDKSHPVVKEITKEIGDEEITKTFINYLTDEEYKNIDEYQEVFNHRTIYNDDKSSVEEYDVFMYRQDNYDCHNFNYTIEGMDKDDKAQRGNDEILKGYDMYGNPDVKTIDANVGVVNLKEYVNEVIQKYMKSTLVEVPTGAIINQFCSLEKWYAHPDTGVEDDLNSSSYAGHRPALMSKRDVGLLSPNIEGSTPSDNKFVQSTIMGACRKVNKLINPNYSAKNKDTTDAEETTDLTFESDGFYKEIIPLYKRDYVLCDGSIYSVFLFPKNFATDKYPNRRDSMERFMDLFFAIGYQYTRSAEYVNKEFNYMWDENTNSYKITHLDEKGNEKIIEPIDILKYNKIDGMPIFDRKREAQLELDRHSIFVEDFLTILAFEAIYEEYSKAGGTSVKWDYEGVCEWLKTVEIPEKYRLQTFLGDSNEVVKTFNTKIFDDQREPIYPEVMELPYYNFNGNGHDEKNEKIPLPLIYLGREVKTFGDPIKFFDSEAQKWTIVEAYKIPQIQYLIDIMTNNPTVDSLAPIMNTYYRYDFQVPYLTNDVPTFIGSSGIDWCDVNHRKLRKVESWSSTYAQKNYMHRHLLFVEPSNTNPPFHPSECAAYLNAGYGGGSPSSCCPNYARSNTISGNSYVASAACRGGKVLCGTTPQSAKYFEFGKGDNPNYIWNELGAGDNKLSQVTIENQVIHMNGMRYPILQASTSDAHHAWRTGDFRKPDAINIDTTTEKPKRADVVQYQIAEGVTDEIWNVDYTLYAIDIDKRVTHELTHNNWYGWEHYEDPRFESAEPNRGRTSPPVNSIILDSVSKSRYEINKKNYPLDLRAAEWYSPENIKMLPLIKL